MKKIICLILVTVMLLACVPMTAFGAVADTDVCKIGDTGYATLDAAISAVKDNETIVLLKDATLSALNQNAINYTIDGQNKAYTISTASGTINIGNANVTFKNVNVTMGASGQTILQNDTNKTGDVTFDGCKVLTYNNAFYKLNGKGNFTLINSTWDKMTGDATVFYFRGDHAVVTDDECVITVDNSTITNHAGKASQTQNNNIFHWNSSAGSTAKFYLKGNTVLKNASTVSSTGACIFYNQQANATMIIHADPTVELAMAATSATNAYFIYSASTANTILYGTPKLTVTESIASTGIYMPTVNEMYSADGTTAYTGWSDGTNFYANSTKYTGAAASFTPAVDTASANGKVAFIRSKTGAISGYYDTLDAAIAAAATNDTIVLLANATLTALNQNAINYTIDGLNKTYTVTTNATWINIGEGNVTFKGVKVEFGPTAQNVFQSDTGKTGDITFDNCQVKAYNNSFYKLNGKGNFTLINSTWDKMTGNATIFYFRGDHADVKDSECVITIDNSTITNHAGSDWQIQNNNIFHWNSSAGSRAKFYLKGNTVLRNASTTSGAKVGCIFHNQQAKSTMIIYADPTVQLIMDQSSTSLTDVTFIYSNPTAQTKIIGNPIYVVNDNVASQGFKFCNSDASITYDSTDTLLGYKATYTESGEELLLSATVAAGKFTKGFSATHVLYSDSDFAMQGGASLRTKDGSGIRFSTNISDSLLSLVGSRSEFGTLIAQNKMLGDSGKDLTLDALTHDTVIALDIPSTVSKWQVDGDTKVFRAALVNIPDAANAYTTYFASRAYMTVTYDDGATKTFYTSFTKDNIRSMYQVAENLGDSSSSAVQTVKNVVTDSGISVTEAEYPTKSIDLYLIAGQSNAAGLTIYDETLLSSLWPSYENGVDNVKLFGYCQQTIPSWTNAKAGQGSGTDRIGPEAGLASVLAEQYTGDKVAGIIKHTYGGTSIFNNVSGYNAVKGNWVSPSYAALKGYTYSGLTGGLYRGLIDEVEAGIALLKQQGYTEINIKSIFWMQGESDRSSPTDYATAFTYFASDLRNDLGELVGEDMSKLPIMIGEISRTTGSAEPSSVTVNETFIEMQNSLADTINDVYVIASGQYEVNTWDGTQNVYGQDNWHWTTEPMFKIGELVGDCVVNNILNPDTEHEETYGTLTLNAPAKIYSNYPAVEIEAVFSKPEMAETLTYTTNNANVFIEDGKVYATGVTDSGYTAIITAKSENFEAHAAVYVETYQGATASGSSLNLETQIVTRQNQITGQSGGDTENITLFVGDSFFNPDNWWTSFYTDYSTKKAYTVGISSSTAEDWQIISERLVYPYAPKAVVLHIGTNDIFDDSLDAAATTARLQTLFNTYHEKMPNTTLYWFNVEPRVGQSFDVPKAVNQNIATFAADKDWLVVIDSASWCFESDGTTVDSTFFKDGIHPANEKYALYIQALTDAGLVIENKAGMDDIHSFPNVIRDKSQSVGTSPAIVTYDGNTIVTEYVVTGTFTLTDINSNGHAEFQFNTYKNRFLIWDKDSDKNLGVGWAINGTTYNETANEEYVLGSDPLVLEWKVLFTETNAYLYINGTLKAVFYNVPSPTHLDLSTEGMTATFTNIKVYTKAADAAVYNEALAAVSSYEAQTGTTARVERVG